MNEILTLDDSGRILLSAAALKKLPIKPGQQCHARISEQGIEFVDDQEAVPVLRPFRNGEGNLVVSPPDEINVDISRALREERDEMAARGIPKG